jgi:6-phosphogluconolactonase/glucosamine-6-phosphate isomerase/deaminase
VDVGLQAHDQELHGSTLASGQLYFNEPTTIAKGITLGMAQVMNVRTLLLLANGTSKAEIIHKACDGPVTNEIPASYIQKHRHAIMMIDKEAAALLSK